jgi:hypothetical protein
VDHCGALVHINGGTINNYSFRYFLVLKEIRACHAWLPPPPQQYLSKQIILV